MLKPIAYGADVITVDDVKIHLRIEDQTVHDQRIAQLIPVAEAVVEEWTSRAVRTNRYLLSLERWPYGPIRIPRPPCIAVSAVSGKAADGSTIPITGWQVDISSDPAWLYVGARPDVELSIFSQVVVDYQAGYSDPLMIPAPLLHAVRLMAAHYFEHTEAALDASAPGGAAVVLPEGVQQLCDPFRVLVAVG